MITVERNPQGRRAEYLAGLNVCFHTWGGDSLFRWAFERAFDGQLPDMLTVQEEDRVVAGSAVTYRNVNLGTGDSTRVGIMTASWTLPEARHGGHFERIIQASRDCAAERGAALLLAFVTASNASYRRLAAAGAAQWSSYYLACADKPQRPVNGKPITIRAVTNITKGVNTLLERGNTVSTHAARFVYTPDEWTAQYLTRASETEFLLLNEDHFAVVETRENTDRILYLSCVETTDFMDCLRALFGRSAAQGRTLLFFTTWQTQAGLAEGMGMKHLPGYLMALPADKEKLDSKVAGFWHNMEWDVQSGDRM